MSTERRLLRKKKRMFAPPFRMNAAIGRRAAATSRKASWNESIALAASRTDISGIRLRLRDIDRNCQYRVMQKSPQHSLNSTTAQMCAEFRAVAVGISGNSCLNFRRLLPEFQPQWPTWLRRGSASPSLTAVRGSYAAD